MFYTIYKVTNKLSGNYYIGKHQTKDLNDGYMGSGKLIKRAIKKHGIENFTKEILHIFETEDEMNAKEKELVTLNKKSYNLCPGGQGGFGYINSLDFMISIRRQNGKKSGNMMAREKRGPFHLQTEEQRKEASKLGKISIRKNCSNWTFGGKNHSNETKAIMSEKAKGRIPWNKGRPRTEEEKQKIREGMLRKQK